MHHHVLVLKLMLICMLAHVRPNESDLHGQIVTQEHHQLHFTGIDLVQDAAESSKDNASAVPPDGEHQESKLPLSDTSIVAPTPAASVDNHLTDTVLDPEHKEQNATHAGKAAQESVGSDVPSVARPEQSLGMVDASAAIDSEDTKVADGQHGSSGDIASSTTPSGFGNHLTDDIGGKESGSETDVGTQHHHEGADLVVQESHPEEKDTPAAIVASEGMFTVKSGPPVAMEQTMEEPTYSGDGPMEPYNMTAWFDYPSASSGDVQIESQVSSGEAELSPSPVVLTVSDSRGQEHPYKVPIEHDNEHPRRVSGVRHQRCEDNVCEDHHIKVTASTEGGLVIPAGITLTVRCSAQSMSNGTATIKWHLPSREATGVNDTADGDEDAKESRIDITEEIQELYGPKRVTVSTIRVANVTEEDAGMYICAATLARECCQRNHTLGIRVYVPPSYAVDFAIVGAVCFVEFLVILYFKTRSDRQGRPQESAARSDNGFRADYQPLPLEPKSKELQIEEEEQQRLT